jgi:alpha-D-ribose 1-methylphosphonate 5-triphosphate synthase subunit PhnH
VIAAALVQDLAQDLAQVHLVFVVYQDHPDRQAQLDLMVQLRRLMQGPPVQLDQPGLESQDQPDSDQSVRPELQDRLVILELLDQLGLESRDLPELA